MMSFSPFGRGARGDKVADVHARLVGLGLLPAGPPATAPGDDGVPVPVYDTALETAVRTFQQARGLSMDGIVGDETYRGLDEARWRLGDRNVQYQPDRLTSGDDVAELQRRLLSLGFDGGKADGLFGRQTEAALRDFQRNVGLFADGVCGPKTYQAFARLTRTVQGGRAHALRESARLYRFGHQHTGRLVVIDPGHGPAEPGAAADGLTEAELVMDIASRLEGRLQALGVQAYLTRGRHGDPDDRTRAEFANDSDADLLVSLHVDQHENPVAGGIATYYFGSPVTGERSDLGERFAGLVQRELVARTDLGDDRVHAKTWELLRLTRMPATRVEVGYLTNPRDRDRLRRPEFRDTVAEAVCAAVQRLFLPPDDDAPTGTLRIPADLRAG